MMFRVRVADSLRNVCGHCLRHMHSSSVEGDLRPRRSLLYIPGNDERKIAKASGLNADIVVLDCEDGVALNRKVHHTYVKVSCAHNSE